MQITTYICNTKLPVIDLQDKKSNKGISVSDNLITAEIFPIDCLFLPQKQTITVKILPALLTDGDFVRCVTEGAELTWARRVNVDDRGNYMSRDKRLTISLNHPELPCFWWYTFLNSLRGDLEETPIFMRYPLDVEEGAIPIEGGKSEVYQGSAGETEDIFTLPSFVPGELLQLKWALRINQQTFAGTVQGKYYATPAITGGKLISKSESDEHTVYIVDVQGLQLEAAPTDFADYQIGDWVYLLKQGDNPAITCNRTGAYTSSNADLSPSYSDEEFSSLISRIVRLVNEERSKRNLNSLLTNVHLMGSAQSHAEDMAKHNIIGHTGSDDSTPTERILQSGYINESENTVWAIGENVARGQETAESVMHVWMSSEAHRTNILSEMFEDIGVGIARNEGNSYLYFVQDFGYKSVDEEIPGQNLRMLPLRVNNVGNAQAIETTDKKFEVLSYDTYSLAFEQFFEMSQHIGIVTEVWSSNVTPIQDAVKVNIEGLGKESFEWIDVFYHCEGSNSIEGGSFAFTVGDEVIVLNEGGKCNPSESDLVVVGFKNKLQQCVKFLLIISTPSGNEAFVWDIITNSLFLEKDSLANIQYEVSLYVVQAESSGEWHNNPLELYETTSDQEGNLPTSVLGDIWTLFDDTNPNDIMPYNPDGDNWNYDEYATSNEVAYGTYFYIVSGTFGNISDWQDGDFLTFSTIQGTSDIDNLIVNSSGGSFDSVGLIGDILGSITEDWTVGISVNIDTNIKYIYIVGNSIGVVYDSNVGTLSQHIWSDNHIGLTYIPEVHDNDYVVPYVSSPKFSKSYGPYFFLCDDGFNKLYWKSEFESMTKKSWPVDNDGHELDYVQRERVFYNPLFCRDFTDWVPYAGNMAASAIEIYDSFKDGDWSEPAQMMVNGSLQDRQDYAANRFDAWFNAGIAQNINGTLVFDAYSFCDYVGDCTYTNNIHIYYQQENLLSKKENETLDLVNNERVDSGLDSLVPNPRLQDAAERHAQDLADNLMDEGGHTGSDGSTYKERIIEENYFVNWKVIINYAIGENVAVSNLGDYTINDVVNAWMDSPGHRANILNENYTETGIACVTGDDGNTYFCQTFGYKKGTWPGFGPMDTTNLKSYMDSNFTWSGEDDEKHVPKIYLA